MIPVPPAIQRIPWKLIALLSAITGFGLLVLYSAAGGNASPWALQQGTRFAIFLTMALAIGRIPLRFFEDFSYLGYLGSRCCWSRSNCSASSAAAASAGSTWVS